MRLSEGVKLRFLWKIQVRGKERFLAVLPDGSSICSEQRLCLFRRRALTWRMRWTQPSSQ